jgi:hypothetical protein
MSIDYLLAKMRLLEFEHESNGWPAVRMHEITELCDEIDRLMADARRLDWLSDRNNVMGNVQLPIACVEANRTSLRGAIDAAMALSSQGGGA